MPVSCTPRPIVPYATRSGMAAARRRRWRLYPGVSAFATLCAVTAIARCCVRSALRAMLRRLISDTSHRPIEQHARARRARRRGLRRAIDVGKVGGGGEQRLQVDLALR